MLLVLLVGIGVVLERLDDERHALELRVQVQRQLDERRDRLHSQLNGDLQLVRGLASAHAASLAHLLRMVAALPPLAQASALDR